MNTKVFRKMKKKTYYKNFGRRDAKILLEALEYGPGDIIGTCTGFNVEVSKVEIWWEHVARYLAGRGIRGEFIKEVTFFDLEGNMHHWPGGGCAHSPYTIAEIEAYWSSWSDDAIERYEKGGWGDTPRRYKDLLLAGEPICDERGIKIIPERKDGA